MQSKTTNRPAFTTAQPAKPIVTGEGDILEPLRRVRDQYLKKAQFLSLLGVRPARDGMYYERAAMQIDKLLVVPA